MFAIGVVTMPQRWSAQSIVEFALVLPIFLMMTLGVVEIGRLVFTNHQVSNAAREGARYAVAHGAKSDPVADQAAVQSYIKEKVTGLKADQLNVEARWPGDLSASADCPSGSKNPGCPVHVTVSYQFQPIVGMVFGSGSIPLKAESKMRIHY